MLAACLRGVIRLWLLTLRCRRRGPPFGRPGIIAFWHGDQLPLLRIRPAAPVVAPVSLSRDGELQSQVLGGFGITSVRGSSSRGGARAGRGMVRALAENAFVLVAVDGPRGPRGEVKPGVAFAARLARAPVYPVGVAVRRGCRLSSAWDRFLLPLPFTRTEFVVGEPLHRLNDEDDRGFTLRLKAALRDCSESAREGVGAQVGTKPTGRGDGVD